MEASNHQKREIDYKRHSPDMFEAKWMNHFSRVRWYVPFLIVIPIVGVEFYYNLSGVTSIGISLLIFGSGLIFWSLMEYLFHKYLFHFNNHKPWSERMHFVLHGVHHNHPNDQLRLVMPPIMSLTIIVLSYFLFRYVLGNAWWPAHSGFITGYLIYDTIHYAIHHANWKFGWFQTLKKNHSIHHFKNEDVNYGVSSPFWDVVFGTLFRK